MKGLSKTLPKTIRHNAKPPIVELPWFTEARICCELNRNVFIAGAPSTGKSTFAQLLARDATGQEAEICDCSQTTDATKLWGYWIIRGDEQHFCEGAIPRALRLDRWLIFEEFSLLPVELREELLPLRAGRNWITNSVTGQELHIPNDFRLIATGNVESLQCRHNGEALRALLSDFMVIHVPSLNESLVEQFLYCHYPSASRDQVKRVVALWAKYRSVDAYDADDADPELTFRAANHLMQLVQHGRLPENQCVRIALVNPWITDKDKWNAQGLKWSASE